MKIRKIQIAIMAATLVITAQAHASLYNITFDENSAGPTTAIGTIDVVGGSAISGFINVLTGPNSGIYGLSVGGPVVNFYFDNLVAPANDPFVDNNGLLFSAGSTDINLYSNGPGSYSLWGHSGDDYPGGSFIPQANGTATLTAVPEPTTMVSGALMLLPFGASMLRILRKRAA